MLTLLEPKDISTDIIADKGKADRLVSMKMLDDYFNNQLPNGSSDSIEFSVTQTMTLPVYFPAIILPNKTTCIAECLLIGRSLNIGSSIVIPSKWTITVGSSGHVSAYLFGSLDKYGEPDIDGYDTFSVETSNNPQPNEVVFYLSCKNSLAGNESATFKLFVKLHSLSL